MAYRKRNIDGKELLDYIKSRCIIDENNCHVWQGSINDRGYGNIKYHNSTKRVHVLTYELTKGPVPDGLELDHLCKNIECCNIDHLEAVTHAVNVERGDLKFVSGKKAKLITHCPKGHEYAGDNLYIHPKGYRYCKACAREQKRKSYLKRKN